MAAAISQRKAMIDHVITCEGESIFDRLQHIKNKIPQRFSSPANKKQSPLLISLEKQVDDYQLRVLRNTSLMFGTY